MQFAANLSMLFPAETGFDERCRRVAAERFKGVEILFPYARPVKNYQNALQQHGLQSVLINTPNEAGSFGYAAIPGQEEKFYAAFDTALEVGKALDTKAIHVMGGNLPKNSKHDWGKTLYDNMRHALKQVDGTDIVLQLEALNSIDVPEYAYADPLQLLPIIQELDHPQVGLQFDFYHTLMQGYDLIEILEKCFPYISHVQLASPKGRYEPDFKLYPSLLKGLKYLVDSGYKGWIGLEYHPRQQFEESLSFLQTLAK